MRRPPGLWILLSAGVVWLSLQDVYGIRATSLIFGRSSTTTTTTTTVAPEQAGASEDETVTTELNADGNATKPTLTGNPQLDYIWDPNLPKELNGYNLSDYPFYERVPEDIDFKCDGLHDGFYASVTHKCQVYHHCLFGTRYDFLCANYTAFDQTLFNCNFVSNVDCENSKKFWHRNDELYIEKSTTTTAPINYNFYTLPPQASPLTPAPLPLARPQELPPAELPVPRRQAAPRARPHARPRPLYDYDEEEYEELPRLRNRKKRPRPRPVYYADYEEYDDDRVSRRSQSRRRPYWRDRPLRRGKDRRKYDYDEEDFRYEYDDSVLGGRLQKDKRRKSIEDYEYEDDRRDRYERRRSPNRRSDKPYKNAEKRLSDDDYDIEEEPRYSRRNPKDETRDFDRRRPFNEKSEDSKKIPRLGVRRPPSEDFEDDLQRADNSRFVERPKKSYRESSSSSSYIKPSDDGRPIIKPVSGTIYDRPRVAPRINLPVPKNAADKFSYKSLGTKATPAPEVLEDDEEYEELPIKDSKFDKKNNSSNTESTSPQPQTRKMIDAEFRESHLKSNIKTKFDPNKNNLSTSTTKKTTTTPANKNTKGLANVDYADYYDDDIEDEKSSGTDEIVRKSPPTPSTTTTEPVVEQPTPIIRKFKRPFLPSRGGNPFSPRNLQPVGGKASGKNQTQGIATTEESKEDASSGPDLTNTDTKEIQEVRADLKPTPVRVKSPILPKSTTAIPVEVTSSKSIDDDKNVELEPEIKTGPIRIKVPIRVVPPVTEQERPQSQNGHGYPLLEADTIESQKLTKSDILNGNYDVTLNEAISPIIPKLPARSFGSFGPTNDYYKRIQRPTKYVILDPVVSDVSPYYVK